METLNLLRELTAIPAISGREDGMIAYMREHLKPFAGNVSVDRLGNVVAHFPGKDAERSLLLFAHMDELGLVVRKIDPDSFVRFERVGEIPEKNSSGHLDRYPYKYRKPDTWIDRYDLTPRHTTGKEVSCSQPVGHVY
jgi:putative aminopeptidase FrvX